MLTAILSFLGLLPKAFDTINNITNAIANEKIAGIQATTQEAKIASDERVAALQAQRDVFIAEANRSKLPIYIQSAIAAGPTSYILKYFLWDKVLGSFVGCSGHTEPGTCGIFITDPIDANMVVIVSIVVGFYFLHSMVKGK